MKKFIATRGLIRYNGKVLLLREADNYHDGTNTGKYDLPGGRLDPGESLKDCLRREIQEEAGLYVTIGEEFYTAERFPIVNDEQWHITGTYFVCDATTNDVILSSDHDHFVRIVPEQYVDYLLMDTLPDMFTTYLQLFS